MSPPPIPRELLAAIASAGNDLERAADFIEEYIFYRRSKGDTLYGVSNQLVELEKKLPARSAPAIRQAQYATNVPPSSDLTPPSGPSHQSAATPQSVLNYLISEPIPDVQHAREVILEYVLAREARIRDKKPGRGGKGTLGRDGFEEIAARLGEIEDGLRGKGPLVAPTGRRSAPTPAPGTPDDELPASRQLGLALVLSLRMLLSYFTLVDLGRQLLSQTPQDAVRTLVQHIRRRVPGEGRFNVGRELEYVESLTLHRRPALRPAFRSARERTHLPPRALYPVPLPAPSKSACIKLLNAFIKDIDQAGPSAATSYMQTGSPPTKGKKTSPLLGGSPGSPVSPTFPVRGAHLPSPTDGNPIESYTLELLSEWLSREKREYMIKNKWAKSGREQLSKDLFDIETTLCMAGKDVPSAHAPALLPVFLLLRRTYALTHTQLPNSVVGSAYEMMPTPPVPDGVPLAEPTVSSTTAALYVNPRLSDSAALDAIEELLESEREKGINADVSEEKTVSWLLGLVDQIEKRFPDGSYETAFEQARFIAPHPRAVPDASLTSAFPSHPLVSGAAHRRSKSSTVTSPTSDEFHNLPPVPGTSSGSSKFHTRSASMPMTSSDVSDRSASGSQGEGKSAAPSAQAVRDSESSLNNIESDSEVDAEFARRVSPLGKDALGFSQAPQVPPKSIGTVATDSRSMAANRDRSNSKASNTEKWNNLLGTVRSKAPPPMLNVDVPYHDISTELSDFMAEPLSATSIATPVSLSSAAGSSENGWWEVVSDLSSPAARQSPENEITESPLAAQAAPPLPPGAQSAAPNGASALGLNANMPDLVQPTPASADTYMPPFIPGWVPRPGNVPLQRIAPPQPGNPGLLLRRSPFAAMPDMAPVAPPALSPPAPGAPAAGGSTPGASAPSASAPSSSAPSASAPTTTASAPAPTEAANPSGSTDPSPTPSPFATITNRNAYAPSAPSTEEVEHAAAAAAAHAATEAKLARNGTISSPGSASTTPGTTPTMPSVARVETALLPQMPTQPTEQLEDFGVTPKTSPTSAQASGRLPYAASRPEHAEPYRGHGMLPKSTGTIPARPPPVPVTMDRPGFPSRAPPVATQPVKTETSPEAPKSKLGSFGRSMSLGARHVMGRGKEKEKEKERENEQRLARKPTGGHPGGITNNPERWNRDMVVGIMGPPVERR